MFKFIKNIFQNNKIFETEQFKLIKNEFKKKLNLSEIEKVFYLGGVIYSDESYRDIKNNVKNDNIFNLLKKYKFNTLEDNIEIYYVEYNNNKEFFIVITKSSYELWQKDIIMDFIKINKINNFTGEKVDLIYSNSNY
jgi:hypothetical protein